MTLLAGIYSPTPARSLVSYKFMEFDRTKELFVGSLNNSDPPPKGSNAGDRKRRSWLPVMIVIVIIVIAVVSIYAKSFLIK